MAISSNEQHQIFNTVLEIIWGLCLWKIVTLTVNQFKCSERTNLYIYIAIFITVTFIIYFANNRELTPIYTK